MPGRLIPLVTNEIYHVFNQGIDKRPTFTDKKEYLRGIETLKFYKFFSPPTKLSLFLDKSKEDKEKILEIIKKQNRELIEILCFCLMPNHFHFLLKQTLDNGISKFMSNFQNSYTRYFNTKNKRKGPLFYNQFKAIRIETDEQLLHVGRYTHLNPYSSFIVKDLKALTTYPWSSFPEYISETKGPLCNTKIIGDFFKDKVKYKTFVFDQADYQRHLNEIKHLIVKE